MIFSSLFRNKPKWQHKDIATRITAIENELSITDQEQHAILLKLVNEDESDLVRRAALIKLASFSQYLAASTDNSAEKLQKFASKQIIDILSSDHQITLSDEDKNTLLEQQQLNSALPLALIETWFAHEENIEVAKNLYQLISSRKSNASHLLVQAFTQKQELHFQLYLLEQVTDLKTLEKLNKKAQHETVVQVIKQKVADIEEAIEKPKKLNKQLNLILSKLHALKDVNDYGSYKQRRTQLVHEWQSHQQTLAIMSEEDVLTLTEKYQQICLQLEKLFIAKAENYQQQIIAEKLAHDKQQDKKAFTEEINTLNQSLTAAIFAETSVDEVLFSSQLSSLITEIKSSVLNENEQKAFIKQVDSLKDKLQKIPEITDNISEATVLISKISQLNLPTSIAELSERQTSYNDWLTQWHKIEFGTEGLLPRSIIESQKEIKTQWNTGLKALVNEQKDVFFKTKRKLQDIKRLLSNGKYKVCFGLFKGVTDDLLLLSTQQQRQLQRDFDLVKLKLDELSDWEHYIATPRKQELLNALEEIVKQPLDNPNEQANKVKSYRATWNSLGHADEAVDNELNQTFNELCEKAFEPCRQFYAQQDTLRAQHLVEREKILNKAIKLQNDFTLALDNSTSKPVDYKYFDGQVSRLQKQWQSSGEVDRTVYKTLQQSFKASLSPVQKAITANHVNNAEAKQNLIKQAQELTEQEDIYQAVESVKQLQQTWKNIGFAGNQHESKLWNQFRQINDTIFAKRQSIKQKQQAEQDNQKQLFETELSELAQRFSDISMEDSTGLRTILDEAKVLLDKVISQKPVLKNVANKVEVFIEQVNRKINEQINLKQKQSLLSLFKLLQLEAETSIDNDALLTNEAFEQLSAFWRKRYQDYLSLNKQAVSDNRLEKTLTIEILAQVQSPKEFAEQRLAVQVKLMQEQMVSGQSVDVNKLLEEWLILGRVSAEDSQSIARLQQVYC